MPDRTSEHVSTVVAATSSRSAAARSQLVASWRRSMLTHGLDPADSQRRTRVTAGELALRQERRGQLLRVADPALDHLFNLVRMSGCAVFLTDEDGVVLDQRCAVADETSFQEWNLWAGSDWSETAEGTNGIGTCIAERRPLVIHLDEHFSARNVAMSCIDAPVHGADGKLIGALDVSSARADQSHGLNRLIYETVCQIARDIEACVFRDVFASVRILSCGEGRASGPALLAVDGDDVVLGATRAVRRRYGMPLDGALPTVTAAEIMGESAAQPSFDAAERTALRRAIIDANGNVAAAARALGIGRATLYRRMKRHGIRRISGKVSHD